MIRRRLARSPLKPHVVEKGVGLAGLGVAGGVGDFGGWVGGQFVTIRRSGTTGSGCSLIASGCWRQTRQACSVDRTSNGAMIAINCLACSSNTVSTARVHVAAEGVDLTGRQCRGGGRFGNDVVIAQETTSSNQAVASRSDSRQRERSQAAIVSGVLAAGVEAGDRQRQAGTETFVSSPQHSEIVDRDRTKILVECCDPLDWRHIDHTHSVHTFDKQCNTGLKKR